MNNLLVQATRELATFLDASLPALSDDWWAKHVVARLTFQQQRVLHERRYTTLKQLDLAALLRVSDQNWFELSEALALPREGRTWLKELQSVRNRWAHLPAEDMPPAEVYRDADTLGRFLALVGAADETLQAIEATKASSVQRMAAMSRDARSTERPGALRPPVVTTAPEAIEMDTDKASRAAMPRYKVGEIVALRSNPAELVPVLEVTSGGPEYRYGVFQNNAKATYYESQLLIPEAPAAELMPLSAAALHARLTALHLVSPSTASLFSLHAGRIEFVPYQYRPVLKLIRADRPRLLIADEVGVGKTIEAGLIIKELRARMELGSVLIVCPKPLVAERKWFAEMKRFDEHFTALDGRLLRHCLSETDLEGEWPEQYANAIVPFSLFDSELVLGTRKGSARRPQGLLSLDPAPKFGLVIVDEAHHIRNADTFLHQGIRYLCDNAEAVVFLSATPVQLGRDDLFTLLNVLRPDLVIDPTSFELMAAPNVHINAAIERCRLARDGWQDAALGDLERASETEWGRQFLREDPSFQALYDQLQGDAPSNSERIGMLRGLEELYTFSGLINRTRRRDIGAFTTRKPDTVAVRFTPSQQQLHDRLLDVVARILVACHGQQNVRFMMTTIRRQAASCLYGAPRCFEWVAGLIRLPAGPAQQYRDCRWRGSPTAAAPAPSAA